MFYIAHYLAAQTNMQPPLMLLPPPPVPPAATKAATKAALNLMNANANANSGAIKINVNTLLKFSGEPVNYKDWKINTKAMLGQTIYHRSLEILPDPNNHNEMNRNCKLYHMLVNSLMEGQECTC